jgi:hypothetical protein
MGVGRNLPRQGEPILQARLPRTHLLAIRLEARGKGITLSEHVRDIVKAHLQMAYYNEESAVVHLATLVNLAKQYLATVELHRQGPAKVPMKAEKQTGLPGAEKRGELEVLVWKAIQEAVAYSKTEAAAKDAEGRLLALRVANGLMRTELALLKHQDDAFVDQYLEELEVDTGELESKAKGKG